MTKSCSGSLNSLRNSPSVWTRTTKRVAFGEFPTNSAFLTSSRRAAFGREWVRERGLCMPAPAGTSERPIVLRAGVCAEENENGGFCC